MRTHATQLGRFFSSIWCPDNRRCRTDGTPTSTNSMRRSGRRLTAPFMPKSASANRENPVRRLLVCALATAIIATLAPGHAAAKAAALLWGACPQTEPDFPRDPRLRCAPLRVPLDYRNPRGPQITITISRIQAAEPGLRRGILLTNPGGPGGAGIDMPGLLAAVLPSAVLARYDLVGFDPRGVGASTPITCGLPAGTPPELLPGYPAPDGSIARNVDFARATARSCAAHSGNLLRHITTANTARDMDRIRAALGEPKLSYLGYSYGTYLGAVYTTLFPQHSDRIILDSAIDPNLVWYDMWRTWGQAVAARLPDFTTWAAARNDVHHLGASPRAVERTYFRIAEVLDRYPLELPDGLVTGNQFREVTRSYLYDDRFFPELAEIWQSLADPQTGPPTLAATLRAKTKLTKPAGVPVDNSTAVLYAIVCNDTSWPRIPAVYARNVTADRRTWPATAGMPSNIWPCAFWPYTPVEPLVKVTGNGPRNVLILQNLRDPATSWRSGFGLRLALGRRAAFVTQDAGGHNIYGARSGPCTETIATDFLTSGALPDRDRFCPGPTPEDVTNSARTATRAPVPVPVGPLGMSPAFRP